MDKEKSTRKKSTDKFADAAHALPDPPPDPRQELPDAFQRIAGFQQRQEAFLKTLSATVLAESGTNGVDGVDLAAECDEYIKPLLARTGPSISAALVTEGAIDQLDKLHGILEQLLDMQAQNYRLRRSTRDVDTLVALKQSQLRVSAMQHATSQSVSIHVLIRLPSDRTRFCWPTVTSRTRTTNWKWSTMTHC